MTDKETHTDETQRKTTLNELQRNGYVVLKDVFPKAYIETLLIPTSDTLSIRDMLMR